MDRQLRRVQREVQGVLMISRYSARVYSVEDTKPKRAGRKDGMSLMCAGTCAVAEDILARGNYDSRLYYK